MDYEILSVMLGIAAAFGGAFCLKHMIWGRGPIWRGRGLPDAGRYDRRLADLEERVEDSAEVIRQQNDQIADLEERLDFAERLLTRGTAPQPEESPIVTPV